MKKIFSIIVSIACSSASADIVQSIGGGGWGTIIRPMGQSFTATLSEPQVSIVSCLLGETFNPALPDPNIIVELRSGLGFTGALLGSTTEITISKTTPPGTWIDFLFLNPVPLISGQTYTLLFSPTNVGSTALSYAFDNHNP